LLQTGAIFIHLTPFHINPQVKQKPPERPFYKASGGFPLTGVEGIEPSSGVLETLYQGGIKWLNYLFFDIWIVL